VAAVGATTLDPPAVAAVPAWAAVDSAVVAEEAAVVAEEDADVKQDIDGETNEIKIKHHEKR
jgi:hypothetical protein